MTPPRRMWSAYRAEGHGKGQYRSGAGERGKATRSGPLWAGIPAPGLILLGMACRQLGAALAHSLFPLVGPFAVATLRLTCSAVVLLLLWRSVPRSRFRSPSRSSSCSSSRSPSSSPSRRSLLERGALPAVLTCGAALAGMNVAFYQALDRLPLGPTVAIELLGPLALAVVTSRRPADVGWVLLAAAGVFALTESRGGLPLTGVAFALAAAGCWVCYILAGARLSRATGDSSGLGLAMAVGACAVLPVGVVDAGSGLLEPRVLLAGLGLALLASVIPYSLEFRALRQLPTRVFGVLMSLEPALAALIGRAVLGQHLGLERWLAICAVVSASLGVVARRKPAADG